METTLVVPKWGFHPCDVMNGVSFGHSQNAGFPTISHHHGRGSSGPARHSAFDLQFWVHFTFLAPGRRRRHMRRPASTRQQGRRELFLPVLVKPGVKLARAYELGTPPVAARGASCVFSFEATFPSRDYVGERSLFLM